jgi:predicted DCC family thiol-disulfide oxidoreductase YuxK
MAPSKGILFFDGVCNLCNGLVKFVIRNDPEGNIKFATLQSQFAEEYLKGIFSGKSIPDSVVYVSGDKHYLKSSAILQLLKDMESGWRFLYGFRVIPRFLRDLVYDLIARTRYRIFGKRESCMIPSSDIMERFIN